MNPRGEPTEISIRPATSEDAIGLAPLMAELGYPAEPDELRRRLDGLAASTDDEVFVASDAARLCGLAAVHIGPLFAMDGRYARLTALVVSEAARGRGVGRRLVEAVEQFAMRRACAWVELTSGRRLEREAAHAFYPALGYEDTGHVRYRRWLTGRGSLGGR